MIKAASQRWAIEIARSRARSPRALRSVASRIFRGAPGVGTGSFMSDSAWGRMYATPSGPAHHSVTIGDGPDGCMLRSKIHDKDAFALHRAWQPDERPGKQLLHTGVAEAGAGRPSSTRDSRCIRA